MSRQVNQKADETTETVDLAELGRAYKPPQLADSAPEVSDVIAEMPWWASRGLLYLIGAFIIAALLWAHFSVVDVTVEARGALVPEGYVKPVQAVGGGVVQAVFVKEGEQVERGQALVQLDPVELRARLGKLRDEIRTSQLQLQRMRVQSPVNETLEQENRIARLESDAAGLEISLQQTTISSPEKGVVTALDVRGHGSVLQAGQKIAEIVPAGTRLVAEARVLNRDIAFIEPGLPVRLRLDPFPYQDYGTVTGTIIYVSPDAQANEQGVSYYKVVIVPDQTSITAKGRSIPLRPGVALTAAIVTERKSILGLILAPFSKIGEEK